MVPSLAVTDTQPRRNVAPARLLEQGLLLIALVSLLGAVVVGFLPVTNPNVQACGSPFVFSWRTTNDVVLPPIGSASAPPNDEQLLAQEPCHQRVDTRLLIAGALVVLTVVTGLAGALIGLVDDRAGYRASPRFETYLRERPPDAPSDPWAQPVVPVQDLGRRLPDIEWREVRVVVWVALAATVVLAYLSPWSDVRRALGQLDPAWIFATVVLATVTYPIAAGGVLAATEEPGGRPRRFGPIVSTSVASSYTGRLLPEYGPAGLAVHHLVRAGQDRSVALGRLAALESVSPLVHGVLVLVFAVVAAGAGQAAGEMLQWQWALWLLLLVGVVVGLVDAPRRYSTMVVRPSRASITRLLRRSDGPVRLAGIAASALALALVNGVVVMAATRASGATGASAPVLLVGLLLPVVVVVAPTPDGAGMAEVALVLGLIWAGVGAGAAVVAMVLVRLVTLWIPMLPGWYALRRLQHDGVL